MGIAAKVARIESAEDLFEILGVEVDPRVLAVRRLSILKRFGILMAEIERGFTPDTTETERRQRYAGALARPTKSTRALCWPSHPPSRACKQGSSSSDERRRWMLKTSLATDRCTSAYVPIHAVVCRVRPNRPGVMGTSLRWWKSASALSPSTPTRARPRSGGSGHAREARGDRVWDARTGPATRSAARAG